MTLKVKTILKNTCWIVENKGTKVASVLASTNGVTLISEGKEKEHFSNWRNLEAKYHISRDKTASSDVSTVNEVHGYPTIQKPYNALWDLKHKVPVFTKEEKSKSFYCAGYYSIQSPTGLSTTFCPKLIALQRYHFQGPFMSADECRIANRVRVTGK